MICGYRTFACGIAMKIKSIIWWFVTAASTILIFAYLCAATYLWARQSYFIFRPERKVVNSPADYGIPYEDLYIPVSGADDEGERIHAWLMPTEHSSGKYLLYLHGSALNIGANIDHAQRFRNMGLSVLLVSYRGYGKSDGTFPEENDTYADAEAAWNFLVTQKKIKPDSIFIYGHSLGGAVAINLAVDHPDAGGLMVESAFTSIVDMAELTPAYRIFPLNLMVHQRFDSRKKVRHLQVPVIYIHGTRDALVPHVMSRILYKLTASAKQIVLIHGGSHNNSALVAGGIYLQAVQEFLEFADKN
jgi:pimeloyl-ACP methyl ester carboxylesterase